MMKLFLAALFLGQVLMYHHGPEWIVVDPSGNRIDTSRSTSQGLQEAILYAHGNGYCLEVRGGAGQGIIANNQITSTKPIYIPAGATGCYRFYGVSLWFNVGPWESGLVIDCQDMLDFDFGGQIIYPGKYSAVGLYCAGSFNEGYTAFSVFTSSRIRILTIALVGADGAPQHEYGTAFSINPIKPMTFLNIDINEVNGGVAPLTIYNGPGNLFGNVYNIRGVH